MKSIVAVLMMAVSFNATANLSWSYDCEVATMANQAGEYRIAVAAFSAAAKNGDSCGEIGLGLLYKVGKGVPQNFTEAALLFRRAAIQGDAIGQVFLGMVYSSGEGLPRDYVQAHMWFNLAAAQGDERAEKLRDAIAELMTQTQVVEAQRLAKRCFASNYRYCE